MPAPFMPGVASVGVPMRGAACDQVVEPPELLTPFDGAHRVGRHVRDQRRSGRRAETVVLDGRSTEEEVKAAIEKAQKAVVASEPRAVAALADGSEVGAPLLANTPTVAASADSRRRTARLSTMRRP